MAQCINTPEEATNLYINGDLIKIVENFLYPDCSHDLEIQRRMSLVSSTFDRLRERVFSNNNLPMNTKEIYRLMKSFKSYCLPITNVYLNI